MDPVTPPRPALSRLAAGAAVTLAALLAAACTTSGSGSAAASRTSTSTVPSTASSAPSGPLYYVSVGDSYAAGYQATGPGRGATTRNGFADQLIALEQARGTTLTLVNFGCSGATTSSMLHTAGCGTAQLSPGAASYGSKTQAAAAEDFLRAHRGHIALVTIVIGGNDLLRCGTAASPVACVSSGLSDVTANLTGVLTGLRQAAGPNVRLIGLTYPDVLLAGLLSTDSEARSLATQSVQAFQGLVNPALKASYSAVGATFVDVTEATGAYGPLTAKSTVAPYGSIPVPVAKVCTLTYACQYEDIHPRTAGYAVIARLIADQLH